MATIKEEVTLKFITTKDGDMEEKTSPQVNRSKSWKPGKGIISSRMTMAISSMSKSFVEA